MDNLAIAAVLGRYASIYELLGDTYREAAYRKAKKSVELLDYEIMDNPIEKIKYIGKDIGEHVDELLSFGTSKHLESLEKSPRVLALRKLTKIAGVGPRTADTWMQMGVKDLPQLRKLVAAGKIKLTSMQSMGLTYYDDLNSRIPRGEMDRIVGILAPLLKSAIRWECVGSYRRGLPDSGDVDIIITGGNLATIMEKVGNLPQYIGTLSLGSERTTFLIRLESQVRQVDILNLPLTEYYFGVLYFTGSWEFNEAMRGYAKKIGYRLNQHGLYHLKTGKTTICDDERCIFDALGLRYVEPQYRRSRDDVVKIEFNLVK